MSITDEKVAELSTLVSIFRDELPQIQNQLAQIYKALAVQETNTGYIIKQYDKLSVVMDEYNALRTELKKLGETVNQTTNQLDKLQDSYNKLAAEQQVCLQHQNQKKEPEGLTWSKFLSIAPNAIALITFIAYVAYVLIFHKLTGGI